jgi:signal transduction histidine kinase
MIAWLPRWVARLRATIHAKLLSAFLLMVLLLLAAAAVGLTALTEMRERAEQMVQLQRKIAAYRQLSHDTVAQLYGVATALMQPDARKLDATLRQIKQFGYDLDRLQFLAQGEIQVMGRVRADFEQFIKLVTRAVEFIREGKAEEGKQLHLTLAAPLADRLERLTNELVNQAEADLVGGIELANTAYTRSRRTVMLCALVSVALALALGYGLSTSLIDPVKRMQAGMQQIGAGNFAHAVEVPNRDELGALARGLNQMSEELARLYAQLEAAREYAERASLDKSRFLAAASHDLRQPMHALSLWVGNMRIALERGDTESATRAAYTIEDSCKSLSTSFNAILDLSRLDAGGVKPSLTAHNVSKLLQQIHAEFEPLAKQKGLAFRLRLSGRGPLFAQTDIVLLGRALRNLVTNAIKYTTKGGVIIGEVAHTEQVALAICDSGAGIDAVQQQHMFTEFAHADRPGDQQSGLGLGLAIVRRSIDRLAGHTLDFYSRLGRGTRFSVRLPLVPSGERAQAETLRTPQTEHISGSYVVVVDDEPTVLQGLMLLLRNWGCLVEGGKSGQEALRAIADNERVPDLLITDLKLANRETGVEASQLLNEALGAKVPVLMLTGDLTTHVELKDSQVPLKLLHKPIVENTLRDVLEELLPARSFV